MIFLYSVLYLFICNWFQLITIISAVIGYKIQKYKINDNWIKETIRKKTGLKLPDITIFEDPRLYGMMLGLPNRPKMVLSSGLYQNFSRSELEWVILHEAGHCVLWHNLLAFIIQTVVLIIGIWLIITIKLSLILIIPISIILSLMTIHLIRYLIEYQADEYAISRVDKPLGVITAQEKFRTSKYPNVFSKRSSLGRRLLHWNINPETRIKLAKTEINKRLQKLRS